MLLIQFDSLRLPIGTVRSPEVGTFVPVQSEPVERLKDFFLGTGNEPFPIGIFNPNDELPAGLTSQQIVVQGGPSSSDVEPPGR
jgi:hypothetical protein